MEITKVTTETKTLVVPSSIKRDPESYTHCTDMFDVDCTGVNCRDCALWYRNINGFFQHIIDQENNA